MPFLGRLQARERLFIASMVNYTIKPLKRLKSLIWNYYRYVVYNSPINKPIQ